MTNPNTLTTQLSAPTPTTTTTSSTIATTGGTGGSWTAVWPEEQPLATRQIDPMTIIPLRNGYLVVPQHALYGDPTTLGTPMTTLLQSAQAFDNIDDAFNAITLEWADMLPKENT